MFHPWVAVVSLSTWSASPMTVADAPSDLTASAPGLSVLFDGVLYNRREIAEQLGVEAGELDDSDLLLRAYRRWGLDLPNRLEGTFALVVADTARRQVLAVRDPLGAHPLFYSESSGRLLFATSIDALRKQRSVDGS